MDTEPIGESHHQKIKKMIWKHTFVNIEHWHDWFAWHPVCVNIEKNGMIGKTWTWLTTVQRRGLMSWLGITWTYRKKI